jgi:hypothetical protein
VNLYIVNRTDLDATDPDTNESHLVKATDEYRARLLASRVSLDEGGTIWFEDTTTVEHIGITTSTEAEEGIIHTRRRW